MDTIFPKETLSAKILIVDDKSANLFAFESILNGLNVEIIKALSGEQALSKLLEHEVAVILLDIQMPGMDGFETAELIRGNADTKQVPIIFITAADENRQTIFKGYEYGAVDLLFKPVDSIILKSKVTVFINLYHQRKLIEIQKEKIIYQQNTQIEKERLKIILQMAGATAHELNQPLMIMLGNIELLEMDNFDPESVKKFTPRIKESAQRLSDTVKKIQAIDNYKTKKHDEHTYIMDFDNKIRILYVDDNADNYKTVELMLKGNTHAEIFWGKSIAEAFQQLQEQVFDVILLAFYLPEGTALDLIKEINNRQIPTPVVCITDRGREEVAAKVLRSGAYDYLSNSDLDKDILIGTIKGALEKFRLKNDLTLALKKMADMSTRDVLTGLSNRRHLHEVMEQEFCRAWRYGTELSCIFFDLDYFKEVNNQFGYACGDFVLKELALIIMQNKRKSDFAFRYGGEEFFILLPQTNIKAARLMGETLLRKCRNHRYTYDNQSFIVTISLGIATFIDCKPKSAEELLGFADKALYRAKMDGRNCLRIFNKENQSAQHFDPIHTGKGFTFLKEELSNILTKTKKMMINSLELLTRETCGQELENETQRIKIYISLLCKKIDLPETFIHSIQNAASLSNCSKIMLGDELLLKKDALTKEEKRNIEQLPHLQVEMLNQLELFTDEKKILRHNQEWYDGSRHQKEGNTDEMPLEAKIFAIINALVAMTSHRNYRERLSHEKAVLEIVKNAGTRFDPVLVDFFLDTVIENNLLDITGAEIDSMKKMMHRKRSTEVANQ